MGTFLRIAFRNVFRNTRRTALTVLVISFGVTALIVSGGFFSYNFDGLRETTIRNGVGHLQIASERYLEEGGTPAAARCRAPRGPAALVGHAGARARHHGADRLRRPHLERREVRSLPR